MTTLLVHPHADVVVDGESLRIANGSELMLDESWSPYAQATILTQLHPVAHQRSTDPRDGVRAEIATSVAGHWSSDVPPVWVPDTPRLFDLGVRRRTIDYRSRTVRIELASDEALLQDFAPLADDPTPRTLETSLRAVVNYVLGKAIPGAALEAGDDDHDVTAAWNLDNLVPNPTFEAGTLGTANSVNTSGFITVSMPFAEITGDRALRVTATAAGQAVYYLAGWDAADSTFKQIRMTAGRQYTASVFLASNVTPRSKRVGIAFRDENNRVVGATTWSAAAVDKVGSWTRYSVTAVAPVGGAFITFAVDVAGSSTGQYHFADGVMITEGAELVPYFDGLLTDDARYDYAWSGQPNESPSTRTAKDPIPPESLLWKAGVTAWDMLAPLTAAGQLRLFCDELRAWRLVPAYYALPGAVAVNVDLTESTEDDTGRDDAQLWATGVVMRYVWQDDNGPHTAVDAVGTSDKVLTFNYDRPYPGAGSAAYRLLMIGARGRSQQIRMPTKLGATPGMELRLSGADIPTALVGRLRSVSFDLYAGAMFVTTKELTGVADDSWAGADPAVRWMDVADSVTWANYDPDALPPGSGGDLYPSSSTYPSTTLYPEG